MNTNTPLLTDQYELIMAQGYFDLGMHEHTAIFQGFFRSHPFETPYTVCAGLAHVIEFLNDFHFSDSDLDYLDSLAATDGSKLFKEDFVNYLSNLEFTCDVEAIPEGTIVFPHEPLIKVTGPLIQCQLLETALINLMHFPSVIATKSAQLTQLADNSSVVEFGLRRAHGPNGGLMASRAAYIGGCTGTSNVLAGKTYGIPILGTMAHSWVMAFDNEYKAFEKFVEAYPQDAVLLVDTYHTETGVQNAIKLGEQLKAKGQNLFAIRLDSGNLLKLSKMARNMLDKAGFTNTKIMASGDIDAAILTHLIKNKAPIDSYGIGTRLSTAADHPYLNLVYKLAAIDTGNGFEHKMKTSDSTAKTTLPGSHGVYREIQDGQMIKDVIYLAEEPSPLTPLPQAGRGEQIDLLTPIFKAGKPTYSSPKPEEIRSYCQQQLKQLSKSEYSVEIDEEIVKLREKLTQ